MNKLLPVWTILFLGLFQSGFAEIKGNDKEAAECLKKWAIKYLNMDTLKDFTLEDVLATLGEKMPDELESTAKEEYPEINAAEIIKGCLNEILFNHFVQRGIEEMKKMKEEQRKENGAAEDEEEDENNSEFYKFFIGLFKTVVKYANLNGPTRLSDRMKASQCLLKYVHNNRIETNIDEFMDGLCRDLSVGEKEIKAGAAEKFIKECLEKEDAHLFDDYKNIALKKKRRDSTNEANYASSNSHFFFFKMGLCYRKEFKPFSELKGMEKMSTLKCLENCGETFMVKFEHLRKDLPNTKQPESSKKDESESGENSVNFIGECFKNGVKSKYNDNEFGSIPELDGWINSPRELDKDEQRPMRFISLVRRWLFVFKGIEDITSLGVEKLIVYDRAYLNMFIHRAKIMFPNYEEIETLHSSFKNARRIYKSCAILLCEAPEASDSEIPFHSWLQNKALMGKELEKVKASYEKMNKLKNQSIDQVYEQVQAAMEQDTKNQKIDPNSRNKKK